MCTSQAAHVPPADAANSLQKSLLVSEERLRHGDQEVFDGIGKHMR